MNDDAEQPEVHDSAEAVEPAPPTIHDRMIAIAAGLPAIGKDSQMTSGPSYNYRGIEDILPHVKEQLAKNQVHILPAYAVISDEFFEVVREDGSRSRTRQVTLLADFDFVGRDGQSVRVTTIGEGRDISDKAVNKAMTAAYKYALIQAFNIADGEDPDASRDEAVVSAPAQAGAVSPLGPQAAQEPSPLQVLIAMRQDLVDAGRYEAVQAYAVDNDIELIPGAPAEKVQAVVEFAAKQLLEARELSDDSPEPEPEPEVEPEPMEPPPPDVDETTPRAERAAQANSLEALAAAFPGVTVIEDVPLPESGS